MDNHDFDKRMGFLKKSYERIPSSFDPEEVLRKIEEEANQSREKEPSGKKKGTFRRTVTVWAAGIASVFLFGVITTLFVLEGQENTPTSGTEESIFSPAVVKEYDDYIAELKKDYSAEREKRRKMLKLEEEKFDKLAFVKSADSLVTLVSNKPYRESMMSIANGKERLKDHFDNAVADLKPPSEMAEDILRKPLVDDEEASIAFLSSYRSKVQDLIAIYAEILDESSYTVESSADIAETLMQGSEQFPQELRNVIATMREQSIEFYTNDNMEVVEAHYYASPLHEKIQHSFHPNTLAYIDMIVEAPYTFGESSIYSVEELFAILQKMEQTLLTVEKDTVLYPILESYYVVSFNVIMKRAQAAKDLDEQGRMTEEFRKTLQGVANSDKVTPLTYIVQPIVEELEASDWKRSESWDRLGYYDLTEALEIARDGHLEMLMYREKPNVQDDEIVFPDPAFEREVVSLYEQFKKSYDKTLFNGRSPIYLVGVFNHANEVEDPATMYRLFHERIEEYGADFTLDNYVANWQKGISLFEHAERVSFYADTMSWSDNLDWATILISFDKGTRGRGLNVVLDDNGVWHLIELWLEPLELDEDTPGT